MSARPLCFSGLSREQPGATLQLAKNRRLGFNPPCRAHRAIARHELIKTVPRGFRIAVGGREVAALIGPLLRDASILLDGRAYACGIESSAETVAAARIDIRRDQHFSPCRMVSFGGARPAPSSGPERLARIADLCPPPLRRREFVEGGVGDRGRFHFAPSHLAREFAHVPRRFGRDEHLGLLALAGERDVARGLPPMMRVQEVGLVERLALALVDRAGVAVTEPGELRCRPHHLASSAPAGASRRARITPVAASIAVIVPALPL